MKATAVMVSKSNSRATAIIPALLMVLLIVTSATGILYPALYEAEKLNWKIQSVGQDIINALVILPLLVVILAGSIRNNNYRSPLQAAVYTYLIYTFIIYCFDVHFNKLFIGYCTILSLSFYGLLFYVYRVRNENLKPFDRGILTRSTGIYLILTATLFFLLWMSALIPPLLNGSAPSQLETTGLFTNPVHVLDLAVVLPGLIIGGILLLQGKPLARLVTPVLLIFCALMNLTIAILLIVMKDDHGSTNIPLVIVMTGMAVANLTFYFSLKKTMEF